ncbi:MAG TPA: hypothetical protein VIH48_01500 [Candidatus Bathyarchaeia archaeon]
MKAIAAMIVASLLFANLQTVNLGFIKTISKDKAATGWLTIPLDTPQNMAWGNVSDMPDYNNNLTSMGVKGHIGDRDYEQIGGNGYVLQEGNLAEASPSTDWTSSRIFLYNSSANNFTRLNITTHKGSTSFGNPTFTYLVSPNDKPCVVVTYYLFSEGAASDEAGELIFYNEIEDDDLTEQEIVNLLANVTNAQRYRYASKDDKNCSLDTLKMVNEPMWSYFGVYQNITSGDSQVRLASSINLLNWAFVKVIDTGASQPTIAKVSNGGYIVAFEKWVTNNSRLESHLKFQYYPNFLLLTLGANNTYSEYVADLTLGNTTGLEGTPNIYNITMSNSEISVCVGFHYNTATETYNPVSIFLATATVALTAVGITIFLRARSKKKPLKAYNPANFR